MGYTYADEKEPVFDEQEQNDFRKLVQELVDFTVDEGCLCILNGADISPPAGITKEVYFFNLFHRL